MSITKKVLWFCFFLNFAGFVLSIIAIIIVSRKLGVTIAGIWAFKNMLEINHDLKKIKEEGY